MLHTMYLIDRSIHLFLKIFKNSEAANEVFHKKCVLKNLHYTGKHLCWNLFLKNFKIIKLRITLQSLTIRSALEFLVKVLQ